ncbi:histidine kinase [Actinokineospora auranticolor]|uniref:histidine kinase n=1 Tax=Actinokineospora auranticolor TaxID=155976 RepID=A0A2S6GC37_9PSEU|nr:histidine kinase [Actinokineospora auranticolor]PPK61872.1 signal transduction histidine kinase [Actinokineospora auranticolor]
MDVQDAALAPLSLPAPRADTEALPRPRARARVIAVEAVTVGLCLGAVLLSHPTGYSFAFPAAVVACLLLPLRLKYPRLTLIACLPAVSGGLGWPPTGVALYRVGRTSTRVRHAVAWATVANLCAAAPLQLATSDPIADRVLSLAITLAFAGVPAAMGVLVRLRRELTTSLTELERARRAELAARLDQARAEERTRIAREIHDAVGHNTTLIAVQAAALAATSTDPTTVQTANHLRELAKHSLDEMRAALGLLNHGTPTAEGLADLPTLITRARAAGLDVRADTPSISTTPTISRAIYRVIQEGLTNAIKHSPGAPVEITLTPTKDKITVTIINGPATHPTTPQPGGAGLPGLTERTHNAGGTCQATPTPDGGFKLEATLPTTTTAPPPTPHQPVR